MDELSMLVTALISGAIAGSQGVATQAVKDCYSGLKNLITKKSGDSGGVATALKQIEENSESEAWKAALAEGVQKTALFEDREIVDMAQKLLDILKRDGIGSTNLNASVTGSGAIAQGDNSVAAGAGGTAIGTVSRDVHIGQK